MNRTNADSLEWKLIQKALEGRDINNRICSHWLVKPEDAGSGEKNGGFKYL